VVRAWVSLYKAPVIRHLLHALALGALAALAVDFGFRTAFIQDSVAYAVTAYTCCLVVFLVGRDGAAHWSQRLPARLPIAVLMGACTVLSLRSWALFPIPLGRGTTSGHSPYVVLICACLLSIAVLSAARKFPRAA
jgi:hypothetical protein